MQGIYKKFFLTLCVGLSFSVSHRVLAERPLVVGYLEFPPATYTDVNGEASGNFLQFLTGALDQAGYDWKARSYPAKRLYQKLITGEVDIWLGSVRTPAIKDEVLLSPAAINVIELRLYYTDKAFAVSGFADLQQGVVAKVRGLDHFEWINIHDTPSSRVTLVDTPDHERALKMLVAGRANYLLGFKTPIEALMKEVPVPSIQYQTILNLPIYIVISKKTPNAEQLMADLWAQVEAIDPDKWPRLEY